MIKKLKNWWFVILGIIILILDQGFDILNPLLVEYGVSEKLISFIKLVFGIYGLIKVKNQLPTQNFDRLQDIAYRKLK
jgi:hypothetical protein